jgi:hypothetical protein
MWVLDEAAQRRGATKLTVCNELKVFGIPEETPLENCHDCRCVCNVYRSLIEKKIGGWNTRIRLNRALRHMRMTRPESQ